MMTPAKSEEEASPCCEVKLSARGSRLIYPFGEPPRQYDVAIPRTVIYIYKYKSDPKNWRGTLFARQNNLAGRTRKMHFPEEL